MSATSVEGNDHARPHECQKEKPANNAETVFEIDTSSKEDFDVHA